MVIKEGYKQTEIGVIPIDWEIMNLGNLFEFKNGLNKEKHFFGYGTPILNYMDVFNYSGIVSKDIKGKVFLTNQEIKTYEVKKGDVFFTRTSETVEEIGITTVVIDDVINTVFSGFVLRGRPKNSILDLNFKKYCFSSNFVRKEIISTASYTTRALTNGRLLANVKIVVPTLKEQTAIATALSDADGLITGLEKLIAKKRNIKQGAMQQLLQPKEGWEVKKLGEIFTITAGGDLDVNNFSLITDEKYCYPIYSNALTNKGLYGFTSEYRQIENTITVTARGQVGVANPRDHKYTAIGRVIMLNPIMKVREFLN
jgi:type I restriction enzyme S subunit